MPSQQALDRAIDNFLGPNGAFVCDLVESLLGTDNAAKANELKSGDKMKIGRALMALGKKNVDTLNGYFDELRASEKKSDAA